MKSEDKTDISRPNVRETASWITVFFAGFMAFSVASVATNDDQRVFFSMSGIALILVGFALVMIWGVRVRLGIGELKRPGGLGAPVWACLFYGGFSAFYSAAVSTDFGLRIFFIICGFGILAVSFFEFIRWYLKVRVAKS